MKETKEHPTWILILTSLGFFMSMMDSMIVTTASTAIRTDFHISVATLQWALNAYNITIAAVLLIGVSLGERLGRRKIYNWGIFIFTIGSILCALATDINWLIVARVIEGIGASVMTPMSMAILTNSLPISQRGKALGIWGGIGGLALIIGPSLGGLIVSQLNWQWIFWINVPVGLVEILLSRKYLPESCGAGVPISLLDASSIILSTSGNIWALSSLTTSTNLPIVIAILLLSLLIGFIFIRHQRSEAEPLVPLRYFRSAVFTGGNIATFLLYGAMYGVVFFLPQYLQVVGGANALQAGLEILPWTGTLVIVAPIAGKAVDKFGERKIAILGLLLQGIGYFLIAAFASWHSYGYLIIPLAISGTGLSMAGPALQKSVLDAVKRTDIGRASGIYNMFRLLGGAVGTTVSVLIFYHFGNLANITTFLQGFQATMIGTGFLSILGILFILTKNDKIESVLEQ